MRRKDAPTQEAFRLTFCADGLVCAHQGALLPTAPTRVIAITQVSPVLAEGSRSCGGVLTRLPGSFSSPRYPENYPTNTQCVWEIRVDKKSRIKLLTASLK